MDEIICGPLGRMRFITDLSFVKICALDMKPMQTDRATISLCKYGEGS